MKTLHSFVVTRFPYFAKVITPNDTEFLRDDAGKVQPMTVYVGAAGTVRVLPYSNGEKGGTPITFTIPAGGMVPVEVWKVMVTGTTATDLIGLY